jgi:hypothetical protein
LLVGAIVPDIHRFIEKDWKNHCVFLIPEFHQNTFATSFL